MDNKKLWDSVLVEMELTLSKPNFNTWFKDTYICKQEEGTVFVSVPNAFVEDWLSNKFHNTILKTLRALSSNIQSLQYLISKDEVKPKQNNIEKTSVMNRELPIQDIYINKEDNLNPRY